MIKPPVSTAFAVWNVRSRLVWEDLTSTDGHLLTSDGEYLLTSDGEKLIEGTE
jgi:hypothetical protein